MIARNADPLLSASTTARLGAAAALFGGVLGATFTVVAAAMPEEQWYRTGSVLDVFSMVSFYLLTLLSISGLFGLHGALAARADGPRRLAGAGAALAGLAAASWMALSAYGVAKELGAGLGEAYYSGWELRLTDALGAAVLLGWWGGLLLLGVFAFRARALPGRMRGVPLAVLAMLLAGFVVRVLLGRLGFGLNGYGLDDPALVVLSAASGALPFLGSALLGWAVFRSLDAGRFAEVGGVAGGMGGIGLGESWGAGRRIGGGSVGQPRTSAAEREKEVLEALRRHSELTVAGAALETSLTVDEADRMLSALAAKGHLDVRAERGRLLYSLWRPEG